MRVALWKWRLGCAHVSANRLAGGVLKQGISGGTNVLRVLQIE